MQDETKSLLFDINGAVSLICDFTQGKKLADYLEDAMLRSACERQFEIIGEALSKALKLTPELSQSITDARRIINFRNVLIHGYATISDEKVWGIIESDLATLKREVSELLGE